MRTRARVRARCLSWTAAVLVAGAAGGVLVRSVSAASAQVAQTMNGVPVQVVPSFPEPGVPLISIAPGTPSLFPGDADPSGSGAGSGSGNDGTAGGAAAVTATGAGSNGSAGGFVAASYSQYLGQVVGNGQCAVLVEAADPSVGLTATWTQGAAVQGNTSLQPGTIIATFDAGGEYAGATDGSSHAAIYLGQNSQGIQVEDQWVGQPAQLRTIPWNNPSGFAADTGSQFYVVSH